MTSDLTEDNEMKQDISGSDQQFTDIESYRKLVKTFMELRRYKSALFWAEKVAVLSNNYPKDVYQLAQCMFLLREYNRAAHIIKNSGLEKTNLLCHYLLVECLFAAKDYQEALNLLNSLEIEDLNASLINKDETEQEFYRETSEPNKNDILSSLYLIKAKILESMDKRALAIDCYIQALQKSVYLSEALDALMQHEMLMAWEERDLIQHILPAPGQCNEADLKILKHLYESKLKKYYSTTSSSDSHPEKTPNNTQLMNTINEKIRKSEQADVRNSISLSTSTTMKATSAKLFGTPSLHVMSPANKILNDLKNTSASAFSIQSSLSRISILNSSKAVNCSKLTTTSTLKNVQSGLCSTKALELLEKSVDVMISKAEEYFYKCEYKKCIKVVDEILMKDPYHKKTLFVQIGCLMELKDSNALFYMAHKLVDLYPDEAISWYAVGCYYDLINKTEQGRRYLTKAASLDRLFGPAWLAYGHSFAKEKEHDQAMAAYFKATQLMRGCHLPLLYIGVECGLTKNFEMSEKFFFQAMSLAPLDVFVLHELGVIKYESDLYEDAEEIFRTTLSMVTDMCRNNSEPLTERWEPLLSNLGHCCRKNKKLDEALRFHTRALSLKPLNSQTYTSIGFVQALMGKLSEAVESFHKSLSLKRDDVITSTILKTVLEDLVDDFVEDDAGELIVPIVPSAGIQNDSMSCTMEQSTISDKSKENPSSQEAYRKLKFDDEDSDNDLSLDMSIDV